MNTYEIIRTPDATTDLIELREYIAGVLLVPDVALAYIRTVREEISKLSDMPHAPKGLMKIRNVISEILE